MNNSTEQNAVFVGQKPINSYVFAVTTLAQNERDILIRARGKSISKAVDVEELCTKKFLNGWNLITVCVGTDHDEKGNISFIEIVIGRRIP